MLGSGAIVARQGDRPITRLLAAAGNGDDAARERLWAVLYDELHAVAVRQVGHDAPGRGLQATSLVHEAYFRLVGDGEAAWANRRHFFAAAANAMRRIRIDYARKRKALKRGGAAGGREAGRQEGGKAGRREGGEAGRYGGTAGPGEPAVFDADPNDLIAVDEALSRLEQIDRRKAEIVSLRYFAGLTVDETAEALGVSARTVDSEWRFAKAWLHKELSS
jgi:RNA polymerase sigma factor (sigma-70 family)